MALISPGVEVTVTNESAYVSSGSGTVPLIVVATATDKVQGSGTGIAEGTTSANANRTYLMTSQRELVTTFGVPTFYQSASGTMLHGYDLNEYGLQTAYSYLGISNQAYILRADIDLSQLSATAVTPSGLPEDGSYWLDLNGTSWGVHIWNAELNSFSYEIPLLLNSDADHTAGVPNNSFGNIGQYVVVTDTTDNALYYKNLGNSWVQVGAGTATTTDHADAVYNATWASSWPTIQGTVSTPTVSAADTITINGQTVTFTGTTLAQTVADINAVFDGLSAGTTGVNASVVNNTIVLTAVGSSASNGTDPDGAIAIADDTGTGMADLGIVAGTYYSPDAQQSSYTVVPEWEVSASTPRPTGSVWQKLLEQNNGVTFSVKLFSTVTGNFSKVDVNVANTIVDATNALATLPSEIPVGTLFADYDVENNGLVSLKLWRRDSTLPTTVTGVTTTPNFTPAETFTINGNTVTLSGSTDVEFVADVSAANIPNVSAQIENTGRISLVHELGGDLVLRETSGTPLTSIGISSGQVSNVYDYVSGDIIGTNWGELSYEASISYPSTAPADNQLWYDSALTADIMVHDGTDWRGYQNVANDFRGYDLSTTDNTGPMFRASKPVDHEDQSALVSGDLWIDTSDLENYPRIYRYDATTTDWTLLDNSDQTTSNGVLFADARWQTKAEAEGNQQGAGAPSSIRDLLGDDFIDPDGPDPSLYPRGILLFNTRRSGFNVKQYNVDAVTTDVYPTGNPRQNDESVSAYYPDRWVTKSGNQDNGAGYFGRKAQRRVVVAAMKSAVDSSTDLREEQREFNLLAAPGYPELISNLVTLNTDRKETGHVVGDTPLRLSSDAAELQSWSSNANAATDNGEDGLVTNNDFMSVYWPSGQTNDLNGNAIVVPPSYMILRTMAYSDSVSYPWFAPAGTARGKITNANSIGYIEAETGEFRSIAVRQGLRDVLYADNINPLTFINGSGLMNFGNKTRSSGSTAIDRVNVARLVSEMRRVLDLIAKPFIFQPNDDATRNEIKLVMEQYMNDLLAKRAIGDYLVVCDSSNNTPARIDRNELYVDIAIEPIKALEFIYIPIRLKNTGEIADL
jgi:hypothetical protein